MIKVFQAVIDKDKGDCMRAAVASLFELGLFEVPNFIDYPDDEWYGYECTSTCSIAIV